MKSTFRFSRGFFSRARLVGRSWEDADRALDSGRYQAVSIDCFDTLLARLAPDWEQITVAEIGMTLSAKLPGRAESLIRSARSRLRGRDIDEPSALSIWVEFCSLAGLPQTFAVKFAEAEKDLLSSSSAASDQATKFVARACQQDVPLIVCSDSRWPALELGMTLSSHGFAFAPQAIVCSCDHNQSKFRGSLYKVAAERIDQLTGRHVESARVLHVGDNLFSDYYSAACHGWSCVNVPGARLAPTQRETAERAKTRLPSILETFSALPQ